MREQSHDEPDRALGVWMPDVCPAISQQPLEQPESLEPHFLRMRPELGVTVGLSVEQKRADEWSPTSIAFDHPRDQGREHLGARNVLPLGWIEREFVCREGLGEEPLIDGAEERILVRKALVDISDRHARPCGDCWDSSRF